jgi:hypothetical protein
VATELAQRDNARPVIVHVDERIVAKGGGDIHADEAGIQAADGWAGRARLGPTTLLLRRKGSSGTCAIEFHTSGRSYVGSTPPAGALLLLPQLSGPVDCHRAAPIRPTH